MRSDGHEKLLRARTSQLSRIELAPTRSAMDGLQRESEDLPVTRFASSPPPVGMPTPEDDEELRDSGDVWSTLKREWRTVLGVGVAVWLCVMLVTLFSGMSFRARARLYLGELTSQFTRVESTRDVDIWHPGALDMGTEVEILTSETLLVRAALRSGLNAELRPEGWAPPSYLRWIVSGRDPQLLKGASEALSVLDATLDESIKGPRKFRIIFQSETQFDVWADGRRVATRSLDEPVNVAGATFRLVPGSATSPRKGARYTLELTPFPELLTFLRKHLTVVTPKTLGSSEPVKVATLEFVHASPERAAAFLECLMNEYLEQRHAWRKEEAKAAEGFVSFQLAELREALAESERRLARHRATTPGVVLDSEARALVEQVAKYQEQRVAARLEVAALSDMKRALANGKDATEAFLPGEAGDSVLWELASSLSQARTELAQLEQHLPPGHDRLRDQRAKVSARLDMAKNYVASKLARSRDKLASLDQVIASFEKKLKAVPSAELELRQLTRESDVYGKLYSSLLEREQQVAILAASTVSKNRVLDAPMVLYREYSPRLSVRLASLFPGLLLGVGVVLGRRRFSGSLQTENDVRRSAKGQAIVVTIPTLPSRRAVGKISREPELPGGDLGSTYAEAFRMLRASLTQRAGRRRGQLVIITSPCPTDGKTTCAFGLSSAFAAVGKSVLLIDGDVRKPSHHHLIGVPPGPGLSDVLDVPEQWLSATHRVPTYPGEFLALTAGTTPHPELLSADSLLPLFTVLKQQVDWVILDLASFPLASDALSLCPVVDHVISVVRLGRTPRGLASDHIRQLAANTASFSLVVNGGPSVPHPAYGTVLRA